MSKRLRPGAVFAGRDLVTVTGAPVRVPDPAQLTHLQFRRFAGCPVCNVHLRSFARRHGEITAAGVREVVLFHSAADELREHVTGLPFDVVADPDKRLYGEVGVESALRALLDPRAYWPILRAVALSLPAVIARRQPAPSGAPRGGRLGLPADLLIASDGRVLAAKYGEHVDDQWSVDELLTLARAERPRPPAGVVSAASA
ncbi:peroxiredoxin-like family protein [Sorangium sp. So ce136]|uniref:peroxiredoxin-like family protein n=1 Tax=Sorangium sp. So ce136 TaxID=3133284 RepID=UPI003F068E9D